MASPPPQTALKTAFASESDSAPTVPQGQSLRVLGIETSCDETGLAVIEIQPSASPLGPPSGRILGEALHSQIDLHEVYGGVVPELASRDHLLRLMPLLDRVLEEAGCSLTDLDLIAVTEGPGLAGALLVGVSVAHGLAAGLEKPVMGIHHLEAHLLSPLLDESGGSPTFPFLALLVSGGHTQLMRVDGIGRYSLLGETIDDAAGEAFDKTAQLMGLGYPGGPQIAQWAQKGNPRAFKLPRPLLNRPGLDFSFAGLKTAVLTQVSPLQPMTDLSRADMAASLQEAIVDVLTSRCEAALTQAALRQLVVAGGVSANLRLRERLAEMAQRMGADVFFPAPRLCTDNGVMVAWAAGLRLLSGQRGEPAGQLRARPRWPLDEVPLGP